METDKITILDIVGVSRVFSPRGRRETMIDRRSYGLSFCSEGQITYTHNGKIFVSDAAHAILLPQGESYEIAGDKTGVFPVINFTCAQDLGQEFILIAIDNPTPYLKDCQQLRALSLFEGNRAEMMSILYNILHRLSREQTDPNSLLAPAIQYLEQHYGDAELSNERLAAECGISEVYFRKQFTKQYGISPKQYILDIRLGLAKQLLSEGVFKVSAVAEKCGFASPYHFSRAFKSRTGITPSQFAAQNRTYKI